MSGRLQDKVAIITGGGSGIGEATAELFHSEGAKVAVVDASGAQEDVVKRLGDNAIAIHADVSVPSDVENAVRATVASYGRVDIMFNNAGVGGAPAPVIDYDPDEWDRVLAVNLKGAYLGMRYAIPEMIKGGGGSVISTASVAALVHFPSVPAYSASKAALLSLTRSAAVDNAPAKVRVNAVLPGVIDTGMTRQLPDALIQGTKQATPLGYIGHVREIASVALFLASDDASFITGQGITADGGYTLL